MSKAIRRLAHRLYLAVMSIPFRLVPGPNHLVYAGEGSSAQLCSHIVRMGSRRLLVVTDKPLVELGLVNRVTAVLQELGVESVIYDGVLPDPVFSMVDEGYALQQQRHCDAVLAIGGGSSIDTAKAIAAVATHGGDLDKLLGYFKLKEAALPLFAIPTTSGTGSEVTVASVISNSETHEKHIIADPKLAPKAVALDAGLMLGMPPAVTAATGMDALTHAVETYISLWCKPRTREYSGAAVRMIFANLLKAYRDGSDIAAREQMALAAYYAGLSINDASVGNVHAIAHQFGRHYGTPHGLANAIVMPSVLRFSRDACKQGLAELALAAGLAEAADSAEKAAEKLIEAVAALNQALNIPTTLNALKIEDIPMIAKDAVKEGAGYPVPILMDQAECEAILHGLLADRTAQA